MTIRTSATALDGSKSSGVPAVNSVPLVAGHGGKAVVMSPNLKIKFQTVLGPLQTWEGSPGLDPEAMYVPTHQIRIRPGGEWHRRGAVDNETACGLRYTISASREYELDGALCPDCHSRHEIVLAIARANQKQP